jgi:sec-independent protein translocase protein TatB
LLHASDLAIPPSRLPPVFNFSGSEIVFLLLLALIVLGPEKLPDAVRKFGKTYGEFKKMTTGFQSELKSALDEPMREMRDTADAFKKAASFDFDTAEPAQPPVEKPVTQVTPAPAATSSPATFSAAPPLQSAAPPSVEPADATEPTEPAPAEPAVATEPAPAEPAPGQVPPRPSKSSITRAPATFRRAPRSQTLRPVAAPPAAAPPADDQPAADRAGDTSA